MFVYILWIFCSFVSFLHWIQKMYKQQALQFSQVVNQWERIASQVPKLKKIEDSRKSALRFCKSPFQ